MELFLIPFLHFLWCSSLIFFFTKTFKHMLPTSVKSVTLVDLICSVPIQARKYHCTMWKMPGRLLLARSSAVLGVFPKCLSCFSFSVSSFLGRILASLLVYMTQGSQWTFPHTIQWCSTAVAVDALIVGPLKDREPQGSHKKNTGNKISNRWLLLDASSQISLTPLRLETLGIQCQRVYYWCVWSVSVLMYIGGW